MSEKVVVFQNEAGGISVVFPVENSVLAIEQIALKDVPYNIPYKIINATDIPTDRTYRDAWEMDFTEHDGVGADYGAGSHKAFVGLNEKGLPVTCSIIEKNGEEFVDYSAMEVEQ